MTSTSPRSERALGGESAHPAARAPLDFVCVDIVGHPFLAIWSPEDGAVRAAGFLQTAVVPETPGRISSETVRADPLWARLVESEPATTERGLAAQSGDAHPIAAALRAYALGDLAALDTVTVRQRETPFKAEVWRALRDLPGGEAVTYSELAALAGRPRAVRAAASGCATNLVAIFVPCHRIVRTDGGLGGYLFGVDVKQRLLEHERLHAQL